MTTLEQLDRINTCIELANGRIKAVNRNRMVTNFFRIYNPEHRISILSASIVRLEARRIKIIKSLYCKYVTKTQVG